MLTAKYFYLFAKYIQFKLSAQMLTITYASLFLFVAFSGWGLANLTTVHACCRHSGDKANKERK